MRGLKSTTLLSMPPVPLFEVARRVPERAFGLDEEVFCRNLRRARRGAAPGPSGMTCEHLQPFLESDRDTGLLCHQVLRMGRLTALKKPQGRSEGLWSAMCFDGSLQEQSRNKVAAGKRQLFSSTR